MVQCRTPERHYTTADYYCTAIKYSRVSGVGREGLFCVVFCLFVGWLVGFFIWLVGFFCFFLKCLKLAMGVNKANTIFKNVF